MPEDVRLLEDLGIIEVMSYGKITIEDMVASLEAIEKIWEETGITKVFVDTRQEEAFPGTIDAFDFASKLPRTIRIAVLADEEQSTAHDVHFVETVARNRGYRFKVFSSRAEALAWLER